MIYHDHRISEPPRCSTKAAADAEAPTIAETDLASPPVPAVEAAPPSAAVPAADGTPGSRCAGDGWGMGDETDRLFWVGSLMFFVEFACS